jgi:hypothetical protein
MSFFSSNFDQALQVFTLKMNFQQIPFAKACNIIKLRFLIKNSPIYLFSKCFTGILGLISSQLIYIRKYSFILL